MLGSGCVAMTTPGRVHPGVAGDGPPGARAVSIDLADLLGSDSYVALEVGLLLASASRRS